MPELKSSQWWWFDSDKKNEVTTMRSPWLHSALAELDDQTNAMLRIIEEDADSFAKRAEMYYKRRPELINLVGDFYRAHRSLAERFDQLRADPAFRHVTSWSLSPSLSLKIQHHITCSDKSYDSYSETYDPTCESDVDDPEQEQEDLSYKEMIKDEDEVMNLRREIERLEQENRYHKHELEAKNEEKREVIRQLSVAIDVLKEENVELRKRRIVEENRKKEIHCEFDKFKGIFTRKKWFKGSPK